MSSEGLHAPRERLTRDTLTHHQAVTSIVEELDAVDWYRQRADDCEDPELREILLHNMREEMEHACMVLEWLRRNNADWAGYLKTYLFTEAPVLEVEEEDTSKDGEGDAAVSAGGESAEAPSPGQFTIGAIRDSRED